MASRRSAKTSHTNNTTTYIGRTVTDAKNYISNLKENMSYQVYTKSQKRKNQHNITQTFATVMGEQLPTPKLPTGAS